MLYILDQRRQRALFVDSMVKSSSSRVLQTASQDANNTNNCIASKVGNIGRRQYKGVRMRSWGSWVSEIRAPNQKTRIWLGSYSTAEAAARAYDAALHCLKGKSSNLNFPSSPPLIHVPDTIMSPKSIQRVAAAAAAAAAANATPTLSPPPLPSSSVPSPGMASGDTLVSIQMDEEAYFYEDYPLNSFDFEALYQSPKCMDYMLQPASFYAPAQVEEWVEEGDISLWSFC